MSEWMNFRRMDEWKNQGQLRSKERMSQKKERCKICGQPLRDGEIDWCEYCEEAIREEYNLPKNAGQALDYLANLHYYESGDYEVPHEHGGEG